MTDEDGTGRRWSRRTALEPGGFVCGRLEIRRSRIGDVTAGDDLANDHAPRPGCATATSGGDQQDRVQGEGRLVECRPTVRSARPPARSCRRDRPGGPARSTAIVQTHHGFVMAAAGIDASNVDKTHLVLLPADPDASARRLRAACARAA
jgi:coenzyme F420-0:L-glutamate ligase/coenzyme F420-1:gamma-L-glutamate ligase